ncbi:hypothetical protein BKA93DRAFT_393144 [Sparassis latifolia]
MKMQNPKSSVVQYWKPTSRAACTRWDNKQAKRFNGCRSHTSSVSPQQPYHYDVSAWNEKRAGKHAECSVRHRSPVAAPLRLARSPPQLVGNRSDTSSQYQYERSSPLHPRTVGPSSLQMRPWAPCAIRRHVPIVSRPPAALSPSPEGIAVSPCWHHQRTALAPCLWDGMVCASIGRTAFPLLLPCLCR